MNRCEFARATLSCLRLILFDFPSGAGHWPSFNCRSQLWLRLWQPSRVRLPRQSRLADAVLHLNAPDSKLNAHRGKGSTLQGRLTMDVPHHPSEDSHRHPSCLLFPAIAAVCTNCPPNTVGLQLYHLYLYKKARNADFTGWRERCLQTGRC